MISANNVTLRVGKKALFEDVNIKFTEGNCYGLIGANGAGKSTFLKILSGQLEPTKGEVAITPGERLSFLQQDQYKYDEYLVLDTVIMGNARLYEIMKEKEVIYAKEDFTDEDGIRASELEAEFATMNGWEAESDAASLLNGPDRKKSKYFWPRLFSAIRIFCSWTSPPTTWIWTPSHGWRSFSSTLKIRLLLYLMTVIFSTKSAHRLRTLTMEKFSFMPEIMISGMSPASF